LAVEVVKATPGIILVLSDLKMPGKTGADLIKIIEAQYGKKIKFILMSGHASPRIEGNGVDISAYPFLRKPLNIETLIEKVSTVLAVKE
jgi:DNA-binding NtrC family response regulator